MVGVRRGMVWLVLLLGCATTNSVAKAAPRCGPLVLKIRGEGRVQSPRQKISVTIAPEPNRSNPLILIEDRGFEADVFYDPLKPHSGPVAYTCDARPERVVVSLVENGRQVDTRQLLFSRDFVSDADGAYVLRTKLRLGK